MLAQFAAQSTAVVCNDAPGEIGDLYRLYVVLRHSNKPVVTGSFSAEGLPGMIKLLAADSGGREKLRQHPRAIFDVCPSPPLNWSEFGSRNLLDLARAGVPAEIVAMPLAGGTAPVTLAGFGDAACGRGVGGNHAASTGESGITGGMGRGSGNFRYADRRRSHGGGGNRHAQHGVCGSREASWTADARVPGRDRFEVRGCASRGGECAVGDAGSA